MGYPAGYQILSSWNHSVSCYGGDIHVVKRALCVWVGTRLPHHHRRATWWPHGKWRARSARWTWLEKGALWNYS